jgi:hypothetical protein
MIYSPKKLKRHVRRVIRVCGYFGHCYISLNLYNKMCGRLRSNKKNNSNVPPPFLSKPFMQTTRRQKDDKFKIDRRPLVDRLRLPQVKLFKQLTI